MSMLILITTENMRTKHYAYATAITKHYNGEQWADTLCATGLNHLRGFNQKTVDQRREWYGSKPLIISHLPLCKNCALRMSKLNLTEKDLEMTDEPKRYCLVEDDSGDLYVIEADHRDEWYSTVEEEQINAGLSWAWAVGGAMSQVTFTNPLIFDAPLEGITDASSDSGSHT